MACYIFTIYCNISTLFYGERIQIVDEKIIWKHYDSIIQFTDRKPITYNVYSSNMKKYKYILYQFYGLENYENVNLIR